MTGFTADWLALRAPFDRAVRSVELARRFAAALPPSPVIADLGAGVGANASYLAPIVGPSAQFLLIDDDVALLSAAKIGRALCGDLARDLDGLTAGANAVTSSALMDLVSAHWFDGFAEQAAQRRWPLLFVLSVDGRHDFAPSDPDDALVCAAFARDQLRDKGFGSALGAEAPGYMRARLSDLGATVSLAASDWRIGPDAPDMLRAFIDGMADAALRATPDESPRTAAWRDRRRAQISNAALSVTVGHQDLLALW